MSRYRRKPDPVHAVQIDVKPMDVWQQHPWTYLIADKRISLGPQGGVFVGAGVLTQVAYPGQWIVWHPSTDALDVLDDETFRQRYEEDHAA